MAYSVVTNYQTTLAAPMTSSQLTCVVNSIKTTDFVPHTITTSELGDGWYLTIAPGTSKEERIKVTAVTPGTGDGGTYTIPSLGRGLASYGVADDQVVGNAYPHNPGDIVILSNTKNYENQLVNLQTDQTIAGTKTFSASPRVPLVPSVAADVPSKNYVDVAVSSASGVTDLLVSKNGSDPTLTINVNAGEIEVSDTLITYAGASAQAVTAASTNYVMLKFDGTLVINTTGFIDGNIPLATVATDASTITGVTDKRPFFTIGPDNQLIDTTFTYGATIAVGDPLRVDSGASNKLIKALGTTAANADGFVGIALDAGVDTDTNKRVLIGGRVTGLSGLTSDAPVYLTDAGGFSATAGTYKKRVGMATSTTTMILERTVPVAGISGNGAFEARFGGTGSDGALTVSSGTTTIDLGGAAIFEKNYTTVNIAAGATLAFSNPNAKGTIIQLRCTDNMVLAGTIDVRGCGGAGGSLGAGGVTSGQSGSDGTDGADSDYILDTTVHYGGKGLLGQSNNNGAAVSGPVAYTLTGAGNLYNISDTTLFRRLLYLVPGTSGGGGGGGAAGSTASSGHGAGGGGSAGGAGAGALLIEVRGTLNFTGSINASGGTASTATAGANASANNSAGGGGGGGGGGGAGGHVVVLYNAQTAVSGTITVTGGAGGTGGAAGLRNGTGASGTGGGGGSGGAGGASIQGAGGSSTAGSDGNGATGLAGGAGGAGGAEGTSGSAGGAVATATNTGDGGAGGGGGGGAGGEAIITANKWFY